MCASDAKLRDVAAEVAAVGRVQAVGLDDHRHRVPAHVGAQAPFELEVAGAVLLVDRLDRVDVAGVGRERQVDALLARVLEQLLEQEVARARRLRRRSRPTSASSHSRVSWASASFAAAPRKDSGTADMACLLIGYGMFWASLAHVRRRSRSGRTRRAAFRSGRFGRPPDRGRQAARPASIIRACKPPGRPRRAPTTRTWPERLFGRWWRRQSAARQDRYATLGPLLSVLLFLAAIISAFWYLRNEEFEREQEAVKRDTEIAQQQIRLRLIENQEQLVRIAREIVTGTLDRQGFLQQAAGFTRERPEITNLIWVSADRKRIASYSATSFPPETGDQRDRHAVVAAGRGRHERARGRLHERARPAPDGLLAAVRRQLRQSGVPGPGAAARPQRVLRHADRRVLDRPPGALLRARAGLEPPRDRAARRRGAHAGQHRDDAAGQPRQKRPSIVHEVPLAPAGNGLVLRG